MFSQVFTVPWYLSSIGLSSQCHDLTQVLVYQHNAMISVKRWFTNTVPWSKSSIGLSSQCHDLTQALVYQHSAMISVKYCFINTVPWSKSSIGLSTQYHDLSQVLVYYHSAMISVRPITLGISVIDQDNFICHLLFIHYLDTFLLFIYTISSKVSMRNYSVTHPDKLISQWSVRVYPFPIVWS